MSSTAKSYALRIAYHFHLVLPIDSVRPSQLQHLAVLMGRREPLVRAPPCAIWRHASSFGT